MQKFMDIKKYVDSEKEEIKKFVKEGNYTANLTIIQLNDDPASEIYVSGKIKDAEEVGIPVDLKKLPASTTETDLLKLIEDLNADPAVGGIIVQMPLPDHIRPETIKYSISPIKDIDAFNPSSYSVACTPRGIVTYLLANKYNPAGKRALVIGRSDIVGRPLANLLLDCSATVTVAHSKTPRADLRKLVSESDLIIVAVGKMNFLNTNDFTFKESAVVVDVGINRDPASKKVYGDAAPGLPVAYQTPVPGGVGLLTRLAVISNWAYLVYLQEQVGKGSEEEASSTSTRANMVN